MHVTVLAVLAGLNTKISEFIPKCNYLVKGFRLSDTYNFNRGYNFKKHFKILVQIWVATSKALFGIWFRKALYMSILTRRNSRLRILRKWETLKKISKLDGSRAQRPRWHCLGTLTHSTKPGSCTHPPWWLDDIFNICIRIIYQCKFLVFKVKLASLNTNKFVQNVLLSSQKIFILLNCYLPD